MNSLRIVILGPQGSGKGTQAELLNLHLGLPTVAMGGLLREEVSRGGENAAILKPLLNAGKLVPHEISFKLLKQRLDEPDCTKGFVLDGFPRALEQQEWLDKTIPPTHVITLEITDDLAVERLGGRIQCSGCGKIYHEKWNLPKNTGICDTCGGELARRADDTPEAIRKRLKIYHEETEEVIKRYENKKLAYRIDASETIPVVHAEILKALGMK